MDVSKAQKRQEGIRQDLETISLPLPPPHPPLSLSHGNSLSLLGLEIGSAGPFL